jgi:hypothetical protein
VVCFVQLPLLIDRLENALPQSILEEYFWFLKFAAVRYEANT